MYSYIILLHLFVYTYCFMMFFLTWGENPRVSPLTGKYECPKLVCLFLSSGAELACLLFACVRRQFAGPQIISLLIITSDLETNKIAPSSLQSDS